MVPFPRLHFYTTGVSPLVCTQVKSFTKNNVFELTTDLFDPTNMMCDCNPRAGRYLTFAAIYRGVVSIRAGSVYEDVSTETFSALV